MDNGKISTFLITIVGIVLAVVIAQPQLLQQVLGDANYARYGAALVAILVAFYNVYFPRNPAPAPAPKEEVDVIEPDDK